MAESNQVAKLPARSVTVDMAERFGMEPQAFEATLRATVMPAAVSREQFAAFLLVAKQYGLNPLLREIWAFPAKGGGIMPVVSVDGWMRIINDHAAMDGMTFEDVREEGKVIAISCSVFRKDRSHPVSVTEYMAECKRDTDPWKKWPLRMLRHKAAIQAARYAFGFSGIYDQDEAERMKDAPGVGLLPPPKPSSAKAKRDGLWDELRAEVQACRTTDELADWRDHWESEGKISVPDRWHEPVEDLILARMEALSAAEAGAEEQPDLLEGA